MRFFTRIMLTVGTVFACVSFASAQLPKAIPVAAGDYHAAYAAVVNGHTVTLAVGCDPVSGDYAAAVVPGYTPGRYVCRLSNGVAIMSRLLPSAIPSVSSPTPQPLTGVNGWGVGVSIGGGTCANGNCGGGVSATAQFYGRGFFRR